MGLCWMTGDDVLCGDYVGQFLSASSKEGFVKSMPEHGSFLKNELIGAAKLIPELAGGLYQMARHPLSTKQAVDALALRATVAGVSLMATAVKDPEAARDIVAQNVSQGLLDLSKADADTAAQATGKALGGVVLGGVASEATTAFRALTSFEDVAAAGRAGMSAFAAEAGQTAGTMFYESPVPELGLSYGGGIGSQGFGWEDYLESQLPAGSRLPPNFKTFDFFTLEDQRAISAKTLNTATEARIAEPRQVYRSLKKSIDAAAGFESYSLQGTTLDASEIAAREVRVAVPAGITSPSQWQQIGLAREYAQGKGVVLRVTATR